MRGMLLGLLTLSVLTFGAGAESPPRRPSMSEQLKLLSRNREVLRALVGTTVKLSAQRRQGVERAVAYEALLRTLSSDLEQARDQDPARVAEMTRHLHLMLENGLVPNLREAGRTTEVGSKNYQRLLNTRDSAIRVTDAVEAILQTLPGKEMAHLRDKLQDARNRIRQTVPERKTD